MSKKSKQKEASVEETNVEGTPKRTQSEQLRLAKARYLPYQKANGTVSLDNGDKLAQLLREETPEAVMRAAEKLKGLEPGTLALRYADRNNGSKRMNAGNILRGLINRGDKTPEDVAKALAA